MGLHVYVCEQRTVSAEVEDVPFNWKLIRLDGLDWSTILDPNKNPESFALIRVEL